MSFVGPLVWTMADRWTDDQQAGRPGHQAGKASDQAYLRMAHPCWVVSDILMINIYL